MHSMCASIPKMYPTCKMRTRITLDQEISGSKIQIQSLTWSKNSDKQFSVICKEKSKHNIDRLFGVGYIWKLCISSTHLS